VLKDARIRRHAYAHQAVRNSQDLLFDDLKIQNGERVLIWERRSSIRIALGSGYCRGLAGRQRRAEAESSKYPVSEWLLYHPQNLILNSVDDSLFSDLEGL
jgi:hypothetical protein